MQWLKPGIDYGIIGLLAAMSVAAMAIAVERMLAYRNIKVDDYGDKKTLEMELTRKLYVIATIGSNAPYIGLLGTVLGIMMTFEQMGVAGFADTCSIMVGLALALKATAVGLFVAIPSVVIYNFLLRKVKVIMFKWEAAHEGKGV